MKYKPPISNEEFAQYANGDYEDELIAIYAYKKRVNSTLSIQEIRQMFALKYRNFMAI